MSELRTNRIIPRDGLPSGSSGGIIQVVFAQTNTEASQTNAATTQTTLFLDKFASNNNSTRSDSKILVMANQNFNITGP